MQLQTSLELREIFPESFFTYVFKCINDDAEHVGEKISRIKGDGRHKLKANKDLDAAASA